MTLPLVIIHISKDMLKGVYIELLYGVKDFIVNYATVHFNARYQPNDIKPNSMNLPNK